jgi:hypothetical protein
LSRPRFFLSISSFLWSPLSSSFLEGAYGSTSWQTTAACRETSGSGELAGGGALQGGYELAGANALSRKHVRAARPAAARVAAGGSEPVSLCTNCDNGCDGAARVPVKSFSGCPAAAELTAPEALTSCLAGADSPRADAGSATGSCRRAAHPGPRGRSRRGGALPSSSQRPAARGPEQRRDGTSCRWRRGCQRSSRRGTGARTGARRQRQDAFWREASARCGGRGRKTAQARPRRM